MFIQKIVFENFKPYYGKNEIDLTVNPEQNIILIGGRNGQGKTSFLVGLVWCIYGSRTSQVDKVFRKEIKNNYPRFLQNALNNQANSEGCYKFAISVTFSDVELSEIFFSNSQNTCNVTLHRSFDILTNEETFSILIDGQENQLIENNDDAKANFIDDYLIPLEAAKFVFFDAENIAQVADSTIKEQGKFMNEALSKMLGLSKYQKLIEELEQYEKSLLQRNSTAQLQTQITTQSNKISMLKQSLINANDQFENSEADIDKFDKDIEELETYLAKIGAKSISINVDELNEKKILLEEKRKKVQIKLNEISEMIPFAISAGRIQELAETLLIEQELSKKEDLLKDNLEKAEQFVECLFEVPEFPSERDGGDIKIRQKAFYMTKAISLLTNLSDEDNNSKDNLLFRHNLGQADVENIRKIINELKNIGDSYQNVFSDYISITNDINDINLQLSRAKSKADDPSIMEYKDKLKEYKKNRDLAVGKKREAENKIKSDEITLAHTEKLHKNLLEKVELSKKDQRIMAEIEKYVKSLNQFIYQQKNEKCASLSKLIASEMRRIMHKKDLFDTVEVQILPEDAGLSVDLKKANEDVAKDILSSGEKQIYISCILKAILEESIIDYPVFIDTPLGRLDKDHKDKFVDEYYPHLAKQVVILTTDEEVTISRKERIENKIAQSYLLSNKNGITKILNDYF